MALISKALSPGVDADAWVQDRVHRRPTPLSPLTFIVPGLHCGRLLRRGLATVGYANVRTAILPQIAEGLGAAALAREGLSPLTSAMQDGAIRTSVAIEAKVFGATARHPATIRTLRQLFQRFRDLEVAWKRSDETWRRVRKWRPAASSKRSEASVGTTSAP